MGSRFEDDVWYNTRLSELILLKLSYTIAKKTLFGYILPIVKKFYPVISRTISNTFFFSPSKFMKNKQCIASHVKSVYEKVKVFVVSDVELCNDLIGHCMLSKHVRFIGLDCEWESSKKNGVALIQISSGNDCILYRLCKSNVIPDNLKQLLENHSILKFGVAIQEDVKRLFSHGIHGKGFVDLRSLAQRCLPPMQGNQSLTDEEDMCQWTSLRSLSINALDIPLNKSYHVRCSNWEAPTLTCAQILYAAKDAIVSLEIFYSLVLLRKVNRQSISVLAESFEKEVEIINYWMSKNTEDDNLLTMVMYSHETDQLNDLNISTPGEFDINKPSGWLIDLAHSLCQGIVDTNHKCKPLLNSKDRHPQSSRPDAISTKSSKFCRDRPFYENCFILGPDDGVLATVKRSKASWYVNKDLGEVTCENPYTVRLFFQPSGRPMPDDDYYTTIKDNVCVVCEGTESFVRKMVIPHDYRRCVPLELKNRIMSRSHDVLLMCLNCHRYAQQWDEKLRQELALKYNAPLGTKDQRLYINNPQIGKVKSAAKALYHSSSKIPEERRKELLEIIESYCGPDEDVTDEVIKRLSTTDIKIKNESDDGSHGQIVVNAFVRENKLAEFIRMWRQHFLTNMKPKHLPPMWSVEHNLDKLRAKEVSFETRT